MTETPDQNNKEILKTFDIYRCFSRIDVVLAMVFIVLAVLALIWLFMTGNKTV